VGLLIYPEPRICFGGAVTDECNPEVIETPNPFLAVGKSGIELKVKARVKLYVRQFDPV